MGGKLVVNEFAENLLRKLFGRWGWIKAKKEISYSEKLEGMTSNMRRASQDMDALFEELAKATKERKEAMEKVESELLALQKQEKELQERVDQLKSVPLPVAEQFVKLTESGEKRSARRDYALFGAGVVVSTAIAILLKVTGLG